MVFTEIPYSFYIDGIREYINSISIKEQKKFNRKKAVKEIQNLRFQNKVPISVMGSLSISYQ